MHPPFDQVAKDVVIMEKRILYTATDLIELLGISKSSAYNLMHEKGFPSFHLGKGSRSSLVVRESDLHAWMDKQIKTPVKY